MKLFQSKSASRIENIPVFKTASGTFASCCGLCFLGLLILLCHSCETTESDTAGAVNTAGKPTTIETKQPETKPAPLSAVADSKEVEEKPEESGKGRVVKTTAEPPASAGADPNIVAEIGEYVITKKELQMRLMKELHPRYGEYSSQAEPVDAKTTLRKMIAEKAMVMDARKQNYLQDETIQASLKLFKEEKLVNLLLANYLKGKITVTEAEIEEKIKANPKLSRVRAQEMVGRAKANKLLSQYYRELYEKLQVQKVSRNFTGAAQIHQRLLYRPKTPRKARWIENAQIRDELTPEEKNIVLATYDTGKVTLKDWFDALCDIGPPSRPRDLHTPQGVERLLERALRMPIFVSEAESLGLDKDENLLKQVKEQEDSELLRKVTREKVTTISGPMPEEEIVAYFEKNKEAFGTAKTLKINQIWCQDLKTAQKVKAELDGGKDFESVRQKYSLQKKAYTFNANPRGEGTFFRDLWKGDPNEIVGPVKGFYNQEVKWRIVKILEKTPGKVTEYSSSMKSQIEMRMRGERRNAALENYRKELLEKYSYEIYAERIRDIDPLNIP